MRRTVVLLYGVVSYAVFLVAFLYAIGFTGNVVVPRSIDSGPSYPLGQALLINILLLGLFAIQHTIMARPAFKRWFTRFVPVEAERSTFVLLTSVILLLIFWEWRAVDGVIWDLSGTTAGTILSVLFWFGWGIVFVSTFLINHFDLFGLRQVYLNFTGKTYHHPPFMTRSLYRFVQHPIMTGFLIAFWATPTMTTGHLLFAAVTSAYIMIGVRFEERDLSAALGDQYVAYRQKVPRFVPFIKGSGSVAAPTVSAEPAAPEG